MQEKFIFNFRESDDYDEKCYGFAVAFDDVDPIAVYQGYPLENEWVEPIFRMEYGEYTDYICNDCGWTLCSPKLKEAIEHNIGDAPNVMWLPAKVRNDDEQRIYYICLITSFLKIDDVVNKEKSRALKDGKIYLPCFDAKKLTGIHIFSLENFNSRPFISEQLKNILEKENFTGLGFEEWKNV